MEVRDAVFYLADNDVSFLSSISNSEEEKIIEIIRQDPLKERILSRSFESLKNRYPDFLFKIVFDMDKYKAYCIRYLNSKFELLNDSRFLGYYFLGKCEWALEFLKKNINRLKELDSSIIFIILRYVMDTKDNELINKLLYSEDLELRGVVMTEFMEMSPYRFIMSYADLVEAFVKRNESGKIISIVDEKYVSRIAYAIVDNNLGMDKYEQVKDFILSNYQFNSLAERLDGVNVDEELGIEFDSYLDILFKDMDDLFRTSRSYKYNLFVKYPDKISKDIRDEFYDAIKAYIQIDEEVVEHMFKVGLGDKFLEFTKKYMELSTGAKVVGNAGIGSTTRAFIVGDYVVKCSYKKWVATRCPDLYLVAKNLEEEIVKSHFGSVIGALEVQKYYRRTINPKNQRLVGNFHKALEDLGYVYDDNVMGLNNTPNIFYLDDYREADCENPEELPKWYKKDPIVLVDRDYVRKLEH